MAAVSQKLDTRLFVRTVVLRPPRSMSELAGLEAFEAIAKTELAASFDILEQAIGDSRYSKSESNHVFFRVLPKYPSRSPSSSPPSPRWCRRSSR